MIQFESGRFVETERRKYAAAVATYIDGFIPRLIGDTAAGEDDPRIVVLRKVSSLLREFDKLGDPLGTGMLLALAFICNLRGPICTFETMLTLEEIANQADFDNLFGAGGRWGAPPE